MWILAQLTVVLFTLFASFVNQHGRSTVNSIQNPGVGSASYLKSGLELRIGTTNYGSKTKAGPSKTIGAFA